jgi:hypothetical protein
MKISKHHEVEDLAGLTADKLQAKRSHQPCPAHADEVSKVFCPNHAVSVCLLCATTTHRECKGVSSLESKVDDAQKTLKRCGDQLSRVEGSIEQSLGELDQHLHQVSWSWVFSLGLHMVHMAQAVSYFNGIK